MQKTVTITNSGALAYSFQGNFTEIQGLLKEKN